jgi:hypothetical protein
MNVTEDYVWKLCQMFGPVQVSLEYIHIHINIIVVYVYICFVGNHLINLYVFILGGLS